MKHFLGVALFAMMVDGQQSGCYDEDKSKMATLAAVGEEEPVECVCHSSCLACGYYDTPIQANDCISCAEEGYELRVEFEEDGTGYCVQELSKRLSVSIGMLISTYIISM